MKLFGFKTGPVLRQYVIVVTANLGFFQFGLTVGWMSPAVVKLQDPNQTPLPELPTETEVAWILSISALVGVCVFIFAGYLANWLGRKYSIMLAVVPRIVGSFFMLFGSRVWMYLLGRSLCGISDIFTVTIVSTYASEIASNTIRGGLGAVSQICSAIGSMITLSIGPFISLFAINMLQMGAIVVTSIPLLFLPESPFFLYTKGKTEESMKILTYLRGNDLQAREELKDYSLNTVEKVSWQKLVKDKITLKTIAIIMILGMSSQITGYNGVSFNLQTIFESTGTSLAPEISSVIIGCIQVFACICTIMLTDRFGRKPVLILTYFWCAVGLIGLGLFFKLTGDSEEIKGFLNYSPLISIILVIFCYNAGIGSLVWILMAELSDSSSRAVGVSIGAFTANLFTFLILRYFASAIAAIGPAPTYWVFGGCCLISCLFIWLVVPETKGKPFSQIQRDLGRK